MIYHNQKIGKLGEDLALKYLKSLDMQLIERNINLKVSEIDLILKDKNEVWHFVEVKSGTINSKLIFDNLSKSKQLKLKKAIEIYISKYSIKKFQIDFAFVRLNMEKSSGAVEIMWDQIL